MQSLDSSNLQENIAALHEIYFDRIDRYFALRLGDAGLAETLAGEVFVRTLRRAAEHQPGEEHLALLLFRFARQMALECSQGRLAFPNETANRALVSRASGNTAETRCGGELPGQDNDFQILIRALGQLDSGERELLALRFGARLDSKEIAQIIEADVGTVLQLQGEALRRLSQAVNELDAIP